MKFISILLLLILSFQATAAGIKEFSEDALKFGKSASGVKELSLGLGAGAAKVSVDPANNEFTFNNKANFSSLNVTSTTEASKPCPEMTEVQRNAIASPSNGQCVFNTDKKTLNIFDATGSIWVSAGSGAGGINYIENFDFESGIDGWSVYSDTSGIYPVDGTGGTALVTFVSSSVTPLRDDKSGLFTKDAVDRQGQGFSIDFTIAPADKTKQVKTSFEYSTSTNYKDYVSGNITTSDMMVCVYDVTNTKLIDSSCEYLYANENGSFIKHWQASPDSVSYRLIGHVSTTSILGYDVRIDNVVTQPRGDTVKGQVVQSQSVKASTVSGTTVDLSTGTATGTGLFSVSGATLTAIKTINVVASINVAATSSISGESVFASISGSNLSSSDTGRSTAGSQVIRASSSVTTTLSPGSSINLAPSATGTMTSVSHSYSIVATYISDNVSLSEDVGNREIYADTTTSSVTVTTTPQNIPFSVLQKDTAGILNYSNNSVTIPESGVYTFTYTYIISLDATTKRLLVSPRVDGATQVNWYKATDPHQETTTYVYESYLEKGKVVDFLISINTGTNLAGAGRLTVKRISYNQTIAASETIAARYTTASGQTVANTSVDVINFDTKVYDTHNAVTTGASWKFTAPASGKYRITSSYRTQGFTMSTTSNYLQLRLFKNGSSYSLKFLIALVTTASLRRADTHVDTVELLQGEYIDVRFDNGSGSSVSLDTSGSYNFITIERVGN